MEHIFFFQLTSAFVSVKIQLEWYEIDNDGRRNETSLQNNHTNVSLILIHKIAYINYQSTLNDFQV